MNGGVGGLDDYHNTKTWTAAYIWWKGGNGRIRLHNALELTHAVTILLENVDTTSATKIADIVITDADEGTNDVTLSGADAASFEVTGSELHLKAGVALDFETKSSYSVTLATGSVSVDHTLSISNVNDPPVFTSSPVNTVTEGNPYTYNITTSDPEDHVVTVTAPTLPGWLKFTGRPNLTVSQPNTIVNDYAIPTGNLAAGITTIPVTDVSAFSRGDQVMIIQMQHTSSAGAYEIRTIASIVNNDITVDAGLANSYYQSDSSKSDCQVPQYSD